MADAGRFRLGRTHDPTAGRGDGMLSEYYAMLSGYTVCAAQHCRLLLARSKVSTVGCCIRELLDTRPTRFHIWMRHFCSSAFGHSQSRSACPEPDPRPAFILARPRRSRPGPLASPVASRPRRRLSAPALAAGWLHGLAGDTASGAGSLPPFV